MSETGEELEELFSRARRAVADHHAFVARARQAHRGRVVPQEDFEEGFVAGNQARVDAVHAAIRDLYDAGTAPDEIALSLRWVDEAGAPEVWKIHQITRTSWCDFCGTPEAVAERLSLGVHNICDRCAALAGRVLSGATSSAANELVVFKRCNDARRCLFCTRQAPASDPDSSYAPIGRDRWWKVPVRIMVEASRATGEWAVACDSCVEFYEEGLRTPQEEVRRFFIF